MANEQDTQNVTKFILYYGLSTSALYKLQCLDVYKHSSS